MTIALDLNFLLLRILSEIVVKMSEILENVLIAERGKNASAKKVLNNNEGGVELACW